MSASAVVHQVVLELEEPIPPEVPVGSDIVLKVRVSCPHGCDLSGRLVRVMAGEDSVAECVHEEFAVPVPVTLGNVSWTLRFPHQELAGVVHERASLPITLETKPLASSLAIWDIPSPVVTGARFSVKVGAKSSGGRPLKAAKVEVLDAGGASIGTGQLGEATWEGTTGLFWTEVELEAPPQEGVFSWSARFPAQETGLAHGEARASFSFAAVRPPDHRLTIRLVEMETEKPIENAHIRLGPFRSQTDACGVAELLMPKGTYEIRVWHAGYEAPPTRVDVFDDVNLRIVGVAVPEEDPSARFML
jgi:hypothetical protein